MTESTFAQQIPSICITLYLKFWLISKSTVWREERRQSLQCEERSGWRKLPALSQQKRWLFENWKKALLALLVLKTAIKDVWRLVLKTAIEWISDKIHPSNGCLNSCLDTQANILLSSAKLCQGQMRKVSAKVCSRTLLLTPPIAGFLFGRKDSNRPRLHNYGSLLIRIRKWVIAVQMMSRSDNFI